MIKLNLREKLFHILKYNRTIIFASIIISILSIIRLQLFYSCILDDSFIFFRYAKNIVSHNSFMFNPGEEQIEGYSSFLYLNLLVIAEKAGFSSIHFFPVIGVFSSIGILIIMKKYVNEIFFQNELAEFFLLLLLSLSPSFVFYATSGMETSFYTFLILLSIYFYREKRNGLKYPFAGIIFFTLSTLTRPEAFSVFLFVVLYDFIENYHKKRINLVKYFSIIIFYLVLLVPYLIWKYKSFGSIIPNTYYSKVGGGIYQIIGGLQYILLSYWYIFGGTAIILLFFVPFILNTKLIKEERFYIAIIIFQCLLYVFLGGDHFQLGRFLNPVFPLVFMFISLGIVRFFTQKNLSHSAKISLGILVFFGVTLQWVKSEAYGSSKISLKEKLNLNTPQKDNLSFYTFNNTNFEVQLGFSIMGNTLRTITTPDHSIALVPIGAIGYYSNMKIIDMVGLVDEHIAHEEFEEQYISSWRPGHDKGDGNYILSREPDFIQLTDYLTSKPQPEPGSHALQYKSIVELWALKEFHNNYEFYPVKTINGWYYNLYKRKNIKM